jgi:hypothetical protein
MVKAIDMYWTLDFKTDKPGLHKNRKLLVEDFKDRITTHNLDYHFSVCKKTEVIINNIWIVRFH